MKDTPTESFKEGSYAWFHFNLIGKVIKEQATKKVSTKMEFYFANIKNPELLSRIVSGHSREFVAIDKIGWFNGMRTSNHIYNINTD